MDEHNCLLKFKKVVQKEHRSVLSRIFVRIMRNQPTDPTNQPTDIKGHSEVTQVILHTTAVKAYLPIVEKEGQKRLYKIIVIE